MACRHATGLPIRDLRFPPFPGEGVIAAPGRPLLSGTVPAGLPAPCSERFEACLSLDALLSGKDRGAATLIVRVSGDSMTGFGIHDRDLLVVDQVSDPEDRSVVVARVDGELTVKQICFLPDGVLLRANGPGHCDILVSHDQEIAVWGVVRWSIHAV